MQPADVVQGPITLRTSLRPGDLGRIVLLNPELEEEPRG